mmetsp:Transcript_11416/g.36065  ORF Transcript_11416/g.36065 Transcript_11416/m.36065 type:complete len:517 (-) Transcript_11416:1053-2603(-)
MSSACEKSGMSADEDVSKIDVATDRRSSRMLIGRKDSVHFTTEEKKVVPNEVFYDLFWVASSTRVSELINNDITNSQIGHFILFFGLFFHSWFSMTMYRTCFPVKGLVGTVFELSYLVGIAGMQISVHPIDEKHTTFFLAAGLFNAGIFGLFTYQAYMQERGSPPFYYCVLNMVGYLGFITICIIGGQVDYDPGFYVIITLMLVLYAIMQIAITQLGDAVTVPFYVEHLMERLGLIIMIYFGESIIGLSEVVPKWHNSTYDTAFFVLVLIWALQAVYHGIQEASLENHHYNALVKGRGRGMFLVLLHGVLGAFILAMGTGIRLLLDAAYEAFEEEGEGEEGEEGGVEGAPATRRHLMSCLHEAATAATAAAALAPEAYAAAAPRLRALLQEAAEAAEAATEAVGVRVHETVYDRHGQAFRHTYAKDNAVWFIAITYCGIGLTIGLQRFVHDYDKDLITVALGTGEDKSTKHVVYVWAFRAFSVIWPFVGLLVYPFEACVDKFSKARFHWDSGNFLL